MEKQINKDIDRITTLYTLGYEEFLYWPVGEFRTIRDIIYIGIHISPFFIRGVATLLY